MGIGDEIMATALAKRLHQQDGRLVQIVGKRGPRWNEIWDNNPRLVREYRGGSQQLICAGGSRPYIAGKSATQWVWKHWDIEPGEIYLTDSERQFAEPYRGCVLIEPHTKVDPSNKSWLWERWQAVVDAMPNVQFLQVGLPGTRLLQGLRYAETQTFRQAAAVLSVCRAFVGPEGGLHHAAAALGVPAVVLYSEFISPEFTGYKSHRNLRHAGPACGMRVPCATCRASMEAITVDEVVANLEGVL